ncbi:MAG: M24 family metallopeptidase [Anaerolineales bacterium]
MIQRDKRVLGQASMLMEQAVDFDRLRHDRLAKVQREMATRDIGALVLTDIMNIRYCTGVSVMPLWTAINLAHYTLVPATGEPVIFEYPQAQFVARKYWKNVREAVYWQARFADELAPEKSEEWAGEIKDVLRGWGVADGKVGVDTLDYYGFTALQKQGLRLTDADLTIEAARILKTMDEIELLRQSATVAEVALHDMEQAIRPGVTENELLATFWHGMLALGGEHCFTRLVASGYKTNPWFQEASSKMVRPGDLIGIDTDMIGPGGYVCDISRTFLCGDKATPVQKEAYHIAHDYIQNAIEQIRAGLSFPEFYSRLPLLPEGYREQHYGAVVHGIGTDDEPPFIPFPSEEGSRINMTEGEFRENMVVSVECYAGKVGAQDGVKLEDEVWVTKDGPVVISLYPYESKLLN